MKIPSALEKRLAAYGTMSLALAAVSAPQAAKAGIVFYAFSPGAEVATAGDPVYFNVLTDVTGVASGAGDFELSVDSVAPVARIEAIGGNFAVSAWGHPNSTSATSAARLPFGATIGSGLKFTANPLIGTLARATAVATSMGSNAFPFGHFNPTSGDTSGYLALDAVQGGRTEYGWADIEVSVAGSGNSAIYDVTLNSFALETDGSSLTAGEGPEPASILLFALGAAGIAAFRRKCKVYGQ